MVRRSRSVGDLWQLGKHRLLCGDARNSDDLSRLLDGERAHMAFLDPPYNVAVGSIVGRGAVKHREFAMASGEMSRDEFIAFLKETLGAAAKASVDGAVHFVCMDWRHVEELVTAGRSVYGAMLNLIAWVKTNAGQGSFYRSQHELIGVFRVGAAPHLNTIELGRHGRNRSNVWHYAGANTFRAGRMDDLRAHPTVKPVAMIADAMKDCTRRNEIVLDTFCGSGTTLLAAERVGRRGYGLEIDPGYVDVAVRRWQAFSGRDALHVASGLTFEEIGLQRCEQEERLPAPVPSISAAGGSRHGPQTAFSIPQDDLNQAATAEPPDHHNSWRIKPAAPGASAGPLRASSDRTRTQVGYGRPPLHSRFKPGQSGNPKGRAKQSRNLRTIVKQVLNEHMQIREGGRLRRMSAMEAFVRTTTARVPLRETPKRWPRSSSWSRHMWIWHRSR